MRVYRSRRDTEELDNRDIIDIIRCVADGDWQMASVLAGRAFERDGDMLMAIERIIREHRFAVLEGAY